MREYTEKDYDYIYNSLVGEGLTENEKKINNAKIIKEVEMIKAE